MSAGRLLGRYSRRTHPARGLSIVYPQILIPIFLLFVAVLTYGWFYWQRAKARGVVAEGSADHSAE
jgi:hypothetical protein